MNTKIVPQIIIEEEIKTLTIKSNVIIGSLTFRGGFDIMSESTGSTPRLWAGGPSMIMLIHKICIAFKGFGICNKVDMAINNSAAILLYGKDY